MPVGLMYDVMVCFALVLGIFLKSNFQKDLLPSIGTKVNCIVVVVLIICEFVYVGRHLNHYKRLLKYVTIFSFHISVHIFFIHPCLNFMLKILLHFHTLRFGFFSFEVSTFLSQIFFLWAYFVVPFQLMLFIAQTVVDFFVVLEHDFFFFSSPHFTTLFFPHIKYAFLLAFFLSQN